MLIDELVRQSLIKVFGDAKLTAEQTQKTQPDGEVVENELTYHVKMYIDKKAVNDFHAALIAAGCNPSPRLGRRPVIGRKRAEMSVFRTSGGRVYSLLFKCDLISQTITVESYRQGSSKDRL